MPRQLLFELTGAEARVLLIAASESRVTIERSLVVALADGDEQLGQGAADQKIANALAAAGISRLDVIAVVGRADVELRLLTVPPTPDAELPSLVRFQAAQELPNLDDDAPLDYLPLDDDPAQPRRVLAAVLKPGLRQHLERICLASRLTLARIVLRSAASASLMLGEKPELRADCWLLVEILGRRVELTAVHRGQVVFLRHVLLSNDPALADEALESLVAEVRRTRVVVANQEEGQKVEPVLLSGRSQPRRVLAKRLGDAVGTSVVPVNPMTDSTVLASGVTLTEQDREYSMAMVGAAMDAAKGRPPAFDFLHPRQPPKPPSRRGMYVLVGLAAAAVVIGLVGFNWLRAARLQEEVIRLQKQSAALDPEVQRSEKVIAASEQVEAWLEGDVVWLDELRWLSDQFPSAADARLTSLSTFNNRQGRGWTLGGLARDANAKAALDRGLQDAAHQLLPKTSETVDGNRYRISFSSSVRIKSSSDSEPAKPKPTRAPKPNRDR
ncbi:MAG: hypothetical protein JW719_08390 [Pirellulales bacterium]|nr:hypothetical protein [Pirellulales bacterium]